MEMIDYVRMANVRMRENLERADALTAPLVEGVRKMADPACGRAGIDAVRLVASGSSYNAAMAARPEMEALLHVPVLVVSPEAYRRHGHAVPACTFTVFISQSGCSLNILDALDFARGLGERTFALTGNLDSDIAAHADVLVDWGVGVESVGYVTMGVETLIEFLMLFAAHAARALGVSDDREVERVRADLSNAVGIHGRSLDAAERFVAENVRALSRDVPTLVCGTGSSHGVALEASLKIMETLKRPTSTHELEEYLHGPDYQLTPDYTVFLIDDGLSGGMAERIWRGTAHITESAFLVTTDVCHQPIDARVLTLAATTDPLMFCIPALCVFQTISAQMTDKLRRWQKHPLFDEAEAGDLSSKTADWKDLKERLRAEALSEYGTDGGRKA